jgi:hypothetical protein
MRAILLGAALCAGMTTLASAQSLVTIQWRQDYDDRQAFNEGLRQGQWDARHNHHFDPDGGRWREADDRRAYRSGYERGYREVNGYGYAGRGFEVARRLGFEDGRNDGFYDRRAGHSFRPTQDSSYRRADNGYDPSYGYKNEYKRIYRESYERGYQQGYNGGFWDRR